MNIRKIEYFASRFRRGIDIAFDKKLFREQPFCNFPNACCGDAPELLAQYLMDNDTERNIRCRYVYGTYRYDDFEMFFGHAWLVVNGLYIVDIAADQNQFKNKSVFPQDAVQPCYVGTSSEFHSMFEVDPFQCREFYGLRNLGRDSYARMKQLYEVILDCIDVDEAQCYGG